MFIGPDKHVGVKLSFLLTYQFVLYVLGDHKNFLIETVETSLGRG